MYEKMMPLAMSQDGFNAAYGGPILNSEWLYFGARFNNWGDMERWYQLPSIAQFRSKLTIVGGRLRISANGACQRRMKATKAASCVRPAFLPVAPPP